MIEEINVTTHQNITMTRGDTFAFGLEIVDLDQDLDSCFFTCRHSFDGEIIFQKSLTDGISMVETGLYRVRVAPDDTKRLDAGQYYYDLEISVNSDVFTLLEGVLTLDHDVTY